MFDFHEKRKIRSILYSKVTIGILFILVGFLLMSVYERYSVEREMTAKREAKERELHDLEYRAAVLESKVEDLRDARGVEEELRNRFDVAKEGEEVIVIVDDKKAPTDLDALTVPPGTEPEEEGSFLDFLKFW